VPAPTLWLARSAGIHHPIALQVLYAQDDIAIISGLNADAPLGTKLAFVSGATG
jgi:hypothetical protein